MNPYTTKINRPWLIGSLITTPIALTLHQLANAPWLPDYNAWTIWINTMNVFAAPFIIASIIAIIPLGMLLVSVMLDVLTGEIKQ